MDPRPITVAGDRVACRTDGNRSVLLLVHDMAGSSLRRKPLTRGR
jgi:hypothetical protein